MKTQTIKDIAGKSLVPTVSLDTIASQANREHQFATNAACNALQHATRCGELLGKAKDDLGHGNFLPWLKTNLAGSGTDGAELHEIGFKSAARCGFGMRLHPRRHRGSDRPA